MFSKEVYINRRNNLKRSFNSGILLFLGNTELPMNYPANTYRFRQDSSFLYFFGLNIPNLAGVIDLDEGKDIIFGNDVDIEDIIWTGSLPSLKDNALKAGINQTDVFSELIKYITSAIKKGRKIHYLPPYRAENKILLSELVNVATQRVKENSSLELLKAVIMLREIKGKEEIEHIDSIMDIGFEMHTTAMKMAVGGVFEREIAGKIEGIALSHGGTVSFPVILSKHGEILHNHNHENLLTTFDLLLCDAGFESTMGYATDHTRTFPVGGKFTHTQKDIYEIVLEANNKATSITKPDITYQSVHLEVAKIIAQGLVDVGLMKGNINNIVEAGAHAMFFPHGLGHMMGIDVHDMEDLGENFVGYGDDVKRSKQFGIEYLRLGKKLKSGFVITNEPGIYFIPALIDKWKGEGLHKEFINFDKVEDYKKFGGIRLEDDLLVTDNGCRILGNKRIPITPDELAEYIG
ncbi:MAG: Xaa-Pro aminopeptidase [Bacteroidetes bacterium GWA2_30_7]|nr:MAG: Xaa-Pro aminopeptidase [Bacteroidetes bacterium GWA2_30_7]